VPHRRPELTPTSRLLIRIASGTERWRPATQWTVALCSLVLVCAIDLASGAQVTLIFLYLLVAGLGAWTFGERPGALFGLLVTVCGATVRHFQLWQHSDHAIAPATELWNLFARILTTGFVVALVSGMRSAIELERWRASTDSLTGVLNKDSFNRKMMEAVVASRGTGRAFVLCYMDLDGFKQVNDRHGHSAGDKVLRLFADGAIEAIREGDLFARIGGDEFVALLAIPTVADGDNVAALVHHRISAILARTGLPVSCSMGALVATAEQLEPLEAAVQLADSLMYEVKRSGKAALHVGRIDPGKALVAPGNLQIRSDWAPVSSLRNRPRDKVADRRSA